MNVILFDDDRESLLPLAFTRPIADFRVGIFTIKQKWEAYYKNVSVMTEEYLSDKFPIVQKKENLWINSSILPNKDLVTEINSLRKGELLKKGSHVVAINNHKFITSKLDEIESHVGYNKINFPWDIFSLNGEEIHNDCKYLSNALVSSKISKSLIESNTCFGNYPIYVEKGAKVQHSILNASEGPIYIGKDAEIMEGSMVRGPFAMCNNSVLKMGSKIYGSTTLGPFCKVGGEVNNVVFFGYSSKAHDGFLGNSVIGEWCNLGADTNNSNLKNNYTEVKLWDYKSAKFQKTGLQFCGLIMADHSKCGINTMFNTGTVVGVGSNIFGSGFQRNFIPSFSWGGTSGFVTYRADQLLEVADIVMKRREVKLSEKDKFILQGIFDMTSKYRNY